MRQGRTGGICRGEAAGGKVAFMTFVTIKGWMREETFAAAGKARFAARLGDRLRLIIERASGVAGMSTQVLRRRSSVFTLTARGVARPPSPFPLEA